MDRDYTIFMQSINEIKDKLEKENNDSYKKILKYYYPKTMIQKLYE